MFIEKIIILYGLPGSGKTRWAGMFKGEDTQVLDFDSPDPFKDLDTKKGNYIFDGLFLNTSDILQALKQLDSRRTTWFVSSLEIHYWREDRGACLWNDKLRPLKRSASITIKNANLESPPDIKKLREELEEEDYIEIKAIEETVKNVGEKLLGNGEILESDSWCCGGFVRDYTGTEYELEPENQPRYFNELETILDNFKPGLRREDYKKILDLIETEETRTTDYYGGEEVSKKYKINLRTVLDLLYEEGYRYDPT